MRTIDNPNKNLDLNGSAVRHYALLVVAIIIGLVGIYFRFSGDSFTISCIANVILTFAVVVALKGVFDILE